MGETSQKRRLSAILAADVVGYTRLMEQDTDGTVAAWQAARADIVDPAIVEHSGRIVKHTGDGFLAEFPTVRDAVICAVVMQDALSASMLDFRMGINLGDIIDDGDDIHGEGVNIAARLEALAERGGICVSGGVYDQVRNQLDYQFEDLGEHEVKHVSAPVRVYRIGTQQPKSAGSAAEPNFTQDLPLPDRPSVVILPFENLTGNSEQDFLADGLRIDIQNALIKVSGVFLIAAGSAHAYGGKTAKEATGGLGVRYALEGSVRRAGNRVRISTTLTDGISGEIVWAENFDRDLDDAFLMLDEITGHILTSLNVKLVAGESAKVWHKSLPDLRSLEAFYRGIHEFFKMDQASLSNARSHFEMVAQLHPETSIGPTWIALTHWYDFQRGWTESREESMRSAKIWAERGVALTDTDGQAHTVLSHVLLIDRDFETALAAGRDAVSNRPSCTHANGFYANVLHYCGEQDGALHHIKLAMRYSPYHPTLFKDILAATYRAAGDMDQATGTAREAIASSPNDLSARLILASIAVRQHHPDQAALLVKEIRRLDPNFSVTRFATGQPYRSNAFLEQLAAELRDAGLPE